MRIDSFLECKAAANIVQMKDPPLAAAAIGCGKRPGYPFRRQGTVCHPMLQHPYDQQTDEANKEMGLDVFRCPHKDRSGIQIRFYNTEGLLYFPEASIRLADLSFGIVQFAGYDAKISVKSGIVGSLFLIDGTHPLGMFQDFPCLRIHKGLLRVFIHPLGNAIDIVLCCHPCLSQFFFPFLSGHPGVLLVPIDQNLALANLSFPFGIQPGVLFFEKLVLVSAGGVGHIAFIGKHCFVVPFPLLPAQHLGHDVPSPF